MSLMGVPMSKDYPQKIVLCIILLFAVHAIPTLAQGSGFRVFADKTGHVHIAKDGQEQVVAGEAHQLGIESEQTAEDRETVGWLVDFADPDNTSSDAEILVIFRAGQIIRRFGTVQVFWSWSFYKQGEQVAYHVGPTHGEESSHCELHDVKTGHLLAQWDGDLEDAKRPAWTRGLDH
jgi:hypothetical protein